MRKIFFICLFFCIHSIHAQINCNNWLYTPSVPSNVEVGQLNIPGNQVTVEALINRTIPYTGGQVWAGDVVSKHRDPTDVNYLLRPNSGEITTTNGYFKTPDIADINLNQTYHIAMVYDGTTLKFYRNGCLMSQIAATGDLIQNSWETSIGYYSSELFPNENFIGYINEVRIWNVARTQAELRTYMNSSLPNPTTQPGLLAYYTFDNLINKQGNPAWNGTLGGTATINQTNPSCNSIPVMMISVSADTAICYNSSVQLFATGGSTYSWSPASTLNDPASATPIATPLSSTIYYVQVSDSNSCILNDSVIISVKPAPTVTKSADTTICNKTSVQLFVSGGSSYVWSPATSLNNATSATPVASPLSSTLYHVKITDANSCIYNDSVNVAISPTPVIKISDDTAICIHNSVPIFVSGGNSYIWSPASTLDNPVSATPLASPLSSTLYHVQITDANSCTYNDSVKVSVNPANAIITKSNDTSICHNTSLQIFASGGSTYIWSPTSSLNNATSPTPIVSPLSSTEYYVKITDANSCIYNDSVKISIKPAPIITKSDDTTICNKASVALFVSGGKDYVWSPASSLNNSTSPTPVASPISTTIYHVSITDANTCVYNDSVKVSVRPPVVFSVSPDNSVCTNNSQQLSASGGDSYTWSPANSLDNPNSNDPNATPIQTTTYSVTIKENTCNESATLSTTLTVIPPPNLEVTKSNDITCKQPSSQLSALGAQDYTWTPGTGLDNSAIATPVASPNISTTYTVVGKDQNGCTNSDTITVNVDYNKDTFYGVPNSFTPNGDGLNDCFGIKYWGQVDQLEFSIYNRFGQKVFYTNNPSACWDGTFKGKLQNPGAFVYVIKAKTACGNIDRKGVVMLIR